MTGNVPRPSILDPTGPWPGPTLVAVIALLLRVSLGLSLFQHGFFLYMSPTRPLTPRYNTLPPAVIQVTPILEIVIGLALVLGFLTALAGLAAAVLNLGLPMLSLFIAALGLMTSGPRSGFGGLMNYGAIDPSPVSLAITTFHQVAVILLAHVQINRISVDALIFRPDQPPASTSRPGPGIGAIDE